MTISAVLTGQGFVESSVSSRMLTQTLYNRKSSFGFINMLERLDGNPPVGSEFIGVSRMSPVQVFCNRWIITIYTEIFAAAIVPIAIIETVIRATLAAIAHTWNICNNDDCARDWVTASKASLKSSILTIAQAIGILWLNLFSRGTPGLRSDELTPILQLDPPNGDCLSSLFYFRAEGSLGPE